MTTEFTIVLGVHILEVEIKFGPNIKDWPEMTALTDDLIIKVVSEIHDPVTTTDELIPSGERLPSDPILLDWLSLHYPEKTLLMWDVPKLSVPF